MRRRLWWAIGGLTLLGAVALQLTWWAYQPEPNVSDETLLADAVRRQAKG